MAEEQFLCPRCQLPLDFVVDKEVQFLGCQKCYGLWVTEPDLYSYVEKSGSPRVFVAFVELHEKMVSGQLKKGSMRLCPFCKEKLARAQFGEHPLVLLDRCPEHGTWLDRTELNKVIRSARAFAGNRGEQ
ncbi:MAG: zf-TFIIB domain-containing protein, partial [Planctomycetota bacterium]